MTNKALARSVAFFLACSVGWPRPAQAREPQRTSSTTRHRNLTRASAHRLRVRLDRRIHAVHADRRTARDRGEEAVVRCLDDKLHQLYAVQRYAERHEGRLRGERTTLRVLERWSRRLHREARRCGARTYGEHGETFELTVRIDPRIPRVVPDRSGGPALPTTW